VSLPHGAIIIDSVHSTNVVHIALRSDTEAAHAINTIALVITDIMRGVSIDNDIIVIMRNVDITDIIGIVGK